VSDGLGRANRKLYHASILLQMLERELAREYYPASIVLEAAAPAIRLHLLDALGWFLLELAEVSNLPEAPPHSVAALKDQCKLQEPIRGELVEIGNLEQQGWLKALQSEPLRPGASQPAAGGANLLAVADQAWSLEQLRQWATAVDELIDRLGHGLDEW
jgi:hypothetical protein